MSVVWVVLDARRNPDSILNEPLPTDTVFWLALLIIAVLFCDGAALLWRW